MGPNVAGTDQARAQHLRAAAGSKSAHLPSGAMLDVYQIQGVLGAGGFGITYEARDTCLDMSVAIKEYFPADIVERPDGSTVTVTRPNDKEMFNWGLDRFIGEGQILARFKHPNIVRVSRYLAANSTGYIVMDFEDGELLSDFLARHAEPPDNRAVLDIFIPLLHGLGEVHKREVLHLDIKPANIYLRRDGSPVLLDFGAARLKPDEADSDDATLLTPGYAPPEQSLGTAHCTAASDIYSLGATLYRCIAGRAPQTASQRVEELAAKRADPYVRAASAAKRHYSPALLRSVDHMLRLDVADRPASVAAVLDELNAPHSVEDGQGLASCSERSYAETHRPIVCGPVAAPKTTTMVAHWT